MIEAISEGGLKPKGRLLAPADCYDNDPVILRYNRNYLKELIRINEGFRLKFEDFEIKFPLRHIHGVETYGYTIWNDKFKISHIVDTEFFDMLIPKYSGCDILVMNMVFSEPRAYPHLNYNDIIELINGIKPKLAILTHFGYTLWKENVDNYAKKIQTETKVKTIAAMDGLEIDLEKKSII